MLPISDNREDSIGDEMVAGKERFEGNHMLEELEITTWQCDSDTVQELTYLLVNVLKYPSTELALKHSRANRLGAKDLIDSNGKVHS